MQLPHIVSSTLTVTRCYLNIIALVFLSTWNQSTRPQATDQSQAKCVGLHITTHDDMITKIKEQHARDCQPAKCRFKNTWDEHKCFVLWWESSQSKHVYRVCLPKGPERQVSSLFNWSDSAAAAEDGGGGVLSEQEANSATRWWLASKTAGLWAGLKQGGNQEET